MYMYTYTELQCAASVFACVLAIVSGLHSGGCFVYISSNHDVCVCIYIYICVHVTLTSVYTYIESRCTASEFACVCDYTVHGRARE